MLFAYILLGLAFVAVFLLGYNLGDHNQKEYQQFITRKGIYSKIMRNSKTTKQDTKTLDRIEKTRQKLSDSLDEYEQNYNELY